MDETLTGIWGEVHEFAIVAKCAGDDEASAYDHTLKFKAIYGKTKEFLCKTSILKKLDSSMINSGKCRW